MEPEPSSTPPVTALRVELWSIVMAWLPATDVVRVRDRRRTLGFLLTSSSHLHRMARDDPVFWKWVCTTRQPSVRCEDDTYSIDVFVRAFLTNTCRLLTSGECITLPADPRAIHDVIMALEEPIQVTMVNIEGDSLPNYFLANCPLLSSVDLSGLTSVTTIRGQFLAGCSAFVLAILPSITVIRHNGCNPRGAGSLTRIDHDQQFH